MEREVRAAEEEARDMREDLGRRVLEVEFRFGGDIFPGQEGGHRFPRTFQHHERRGPMDNFGPHWHRGERHPSPHRRLGPTRDRRNSAGYDNPNADYTYAPHQNRNRDHRRPSVASIIHNNNGFPSTFNYGNPDEDDIIAARHRYSGCVSAEDPPSYHTEARHETQEAARGRPGRERDVRRSQQRFRPFGQRGQDRARQGGGLRDGEESADGRVYSDSVLDGGADGDDADDEGIGRRRNW